MKEIIAYKTTDNKIFDNAVEASDHQYAVDLKKELETFIDKYGWSGMTTRDCSHILYENWSEFCTLINQFNTKKKRSK